MDFLTQQEVSGIRQDIRHGEAKQFAEKNEFERKLLGELGEEMEKELENPDTKRNKEFAKKYILPYLVGIEGISKINSQSIQTRIENLYEDIFPLKPDGLQDNKVDFALNEVTTKSTTTEFENACRQAFDDMKQAISYGISEVIRLHGLIYAKSLLNIVS